MQRNQFMYALAFSLAMATAYAASQEPMPAAKKPAVRTAAPPKTAPNPVAAKEDKSISVTTQASTGTATPPAPVIPAAAPPVSAPPLRLPMTGLSSGEIQRRIQKALSAEPSLAGSSLSVAVTDEEISLSGSVGNGKERISARRIAQSFGGNRRFKENVTVNTPRVAPGADSQKPLEKKNPGVSGQSGKQQNGLLEAIKSGR